MISSYPIDQETDQRIENTFQHHPPFGNQLRRYKLLRDEAKALAYTIVSFTPKSREQSLALTHLEEVVFFANAAIARHEKPAPVDVGEFKGCYGGHDPNELPGLSEESGGDPIPRRVEGIPPGNVLPKRTVNVIPA